MAQPLDQSINSLEQFREVAILNPAVGDVLQYNGWEWRNAAASAGSGPTTKRVATNLSYGAITNISDFTFAASANKTYSVSGTLLVAMTSANDGDVRVKCSGAPSGASLTCSIQSGDQGSAFYQDGSSSTLSSSPSGYGTMQRAVFVCGIIKTSATAGNFTFTIEEVNSEHAGTLAANSFLTFTEIA